MNESDFFAVLLDEVVMHDPVAIEMNTHTLWALRNSDLGVLGVQINIDDTLAYLDVRLVDVRE